MGRQIAIETGRARIRAGIIAALAVATLGLTIVSSSPAASERVDVNRASLSELTELPGIGPSKAAAIIEEREIAPFKSIDDLARVRGIGDATLSELRDYITVGRSAASASSSESARRN